MNSLAFVFQAVLSLYASKRTSGIVVHIGFNTTSIVPSKQLFLFSFLYVTLDASEITEIFQIFTVF